MLLELIFTVILQNITDTHTHARTRSPLLGLLSEPKRILKLADVLYMGQLRLSPIYLKLFLELSLEVSHDLSHDLYLELCSELLCELLFKLIIQLLPKLSLKLSTMNSLLKYLFWALLKSLELLGSWRDCWKPFSKLYCIKYTDRQTHRHRSQITSSRAPVGAKN